MGHNSVISVPNQRSNSDSRFDSTTTIRFVTPNRISLWLRYFCSQKNLVYKKFICPALGLFLFYCLSFPFFHVSLCWSQANLSSKDCQCEKGNPSVTRIYDKLPKTNTTQTLQEKLKAFFYEYAHNKPVYLCAYFTMTNLKFLS